MNTEESSYLQYAGPDPNVNGLDWETWAFIMVANKRFNLLEYEIEKQTLTLKGNKEPSQALMNRFDRVQNAVIEADSSAAFIERSRKYLGLTSLIKLFIKDLDSEINFISSRNIEYVTVCSVPWERNTDRPVIDHVKPMLAISTKIRLLRYQNGMLSDESLIYLRNNPIEFIDLQHITISNETLFTNFLSNTPTLKKLALQGLATRDAQTCFLSSGNTAKNQITHLWITLQTRLRTLYHEIGKCEKLESIVLSFEKPELLGIVLPCLLELNHMKKIVINFYPLRGNGNYGEELRQTAFYKDFFKSSFDARNVVLQYYHEYLTHREQPRN